MSTSLYVYTARKQTLDEALAAFQPTLPNEGAVALLYTPERCFFARLGKDGALTDSGRQTIDLASTRVYEARVFHANAELRWLNDPGPDSAHQTVVLADLEYNLDETLRLSCLSVTTHQKQTYLLWGEGLGPVADLTAGLWSRLATARIGSLDVPLPNLSHGERVRLRALEYFATYEDGNVGVLDERLLGLEVDRG